MSVFYGIVEGGVELAGDQRGGHFKVRAGMTKNGVRMFLWKEDKR